MKAYKLTYNGKNETRKYIFVNNPSELESKKLDFLFKHSGTRLETKNNWVAIQPMTLKG